MDEFSFPANPSASHVTIAAGIPRRDTANKSEDLCEHSDRKPGLRRALEAIGSFFRHAKRLGSRTFKDRLLD